MAKETENKKPTSAKSQPAKKQDVKKAPSATSKKK